MIARIVLALLASLWGSLCFWLGLWLTFPSEAAIDRIVYEVDVRTDRSMALRADGVSPWWLTGASFEAAKLYTVPSARRRDPEPPAPELLLDTQRLSGRLNILPLLRGVISVGLDAELYEGTLVGDVAADGPRVVIDLLADELNLSRYVFGGDTWAADLGGRLRLRVDATYNKDEVKESEGRVRLEIDELKIHSAKVMGFDLPEATFTEALLSFRVENGRAEVRHGTFVSDAISAEVDGDVTLNQEFGRSRLNLTVDVKLGDELDTLARLAPGVKDARDDDGVYHFDCIGTVDAPSCRPKRSGRAAARPPTPRIGGGDDLGALPSRRVTGGGADELDVPDDERAARREAQLAERRERIRKRREEREATERDAPEPADDRRGGLELQGDEDFGDEEFIDDGFDDGFEGDELPAAGDFDEDQLAPGLDDLGYIDE